MILRELIGFSDQGADAFFGEPEFETSDFLRTTADGKGLISLVELPNLRDRPAVFSTFLMWLLADLFHDLPEVGDVDKPKLVFFFDEAHLLFDDASKAFLDPIAQTVRLIRSKGVGVFFVTQIADRRTRRGAGPARLPGAAPAPRGHTPTTPRRSRQTVNTYPHSAYDDLGQVITSLGIGEAIVTVMNERGAPTPVAWTRLRAPESLMGADRPGRDAAGGDRVSPLNAKYAASVDRESARELLAAKLEAGAEKARQEQEATAEEKLRREADKASSRTPQPASRARRSRSSRRSSPRPPSARSPARPPARSSAACSGPAVADRTVQSTGVSSRGAFSSPWPGHQATCPIRAVSAGVKNIAITNAATKMPKEMEKPSAMSSALPPEHQRRRRCRPGSAPAAATVGPACLTASAAASRDALPARASSRSRAIIKML